MIPPLDIWGTIVGIFLGLTILDVIVVVVIAFAIWRFLSGLSSEQKGLVIAFLIVVGFVLIVTVIGLEIGAIMVLAGALAAVLNVVRPMAVEE